MTPAANIIEFPGRRPDHQDGPSESFIRLTRNPDIRPPARVERTVKGPKDIVI